MSDLYVEREQLREKLNQCVLLMRKTGTEYAEADRAYNLAVRTAWMRLRDEGMPVGMISKVYKGEKEVADKRFVLIVAEGMRDANKEALLSYKLQLRLVEEQIQREYADPQAGF